MDNQFNNSPQLNPKKNIFIYFLYGIEILIPILLLALIFFILNYLNILRFGNVFPFLSFLPHLPSQSSSTSPKIHPQITSYQYSQTALYKAFYTYLNEIVAPEVRPLETPPSQSQSSQQQSRLTWSSPDATEEAHLTYGMNSSSLQELSLFIVPKTPLPQTVSADVVSTILKHYFTPTSINGITCKTLNNNYTFCEQFTQNDNYKEGFGLFVSPPSLTPLYFIFSCRVFPSYPSYTKMTSCSPSKS